MTARPTVVIYGNCQAQFLHLVATHVPSLAARLEFVLASALVEPGAAAAAIPEQASRAVLLWEQYDRRPGLPYRDSLCERLAKDCGVLRFPALGMNAFWPFFIKDPRNAPEPGYPWGRYPAGDRVAIEVAERSFPPAEAYAEYLRRSQAMMPDLAQALSRERTVQLQRDAGSDVAMEDYVFSNLRTTYQFWTRGHLASPVVGELLLRLLQRSAQILGSIEGSVKAEVAAVCEQFPGQGEFQHPIHPVVARELGLQFADERRKYRWFAESWTFEEHMTRYLAFDRSW